MFCPMGYSTISHIYDFAMEASFDHFFNSAIEFCEAGAKIGEDMAARQFFAISPMDWVEFEVFKIIGNDLFISSPIGQVMRLDMSTLRSTIDFWEFTATGLEAEAQNRPEVGDVPHDFRYNFRLFDFPRTEFLSEFRNPSVNHGSATLWEFAKSMNMDHLHHKIPMFYERRGFTITLQAFDYVSRFDFIEMDEWIDIARILRPFEGWSLCVKQEFFDSGRWKEALLRKGGQGTSEAASGTATEPLSPPAVARKIIHEWRQGRRFPKPEFQRRFAPGKSKGWFDMAWRLAVAEEKDLAKAGRRPQLIKSNSNPIED